MTTALIAEDEALLRDALRGALAQAWPALQLVAECEDGGSALETIVEQQPDVAFLDIRMPGLTGLEVAAAALAAGARTRIVFVTAYDQYAIDAFDAGAVDYLLKPVEGARLQRTVQRLQTQLAAGAPPDDALAPLLQRLIGALPRRAEQPLVWLTASVGTATKLILVDDVLYFRAEQKYTVVVTADGEALLRTPLKDLLPRLDASRFRQVHRGTIVALAAIDRVQRDDSGKGVLTLRGRRETLAVSQPFMSLFRSM